MRHASFPGVMTLLLASASARAEPPALVPSPVVAEEAPALACRGNVDCRDDLVCRGTRCVPSAADADTLRTVHRAPLYPNSKPGLWGPGVALLVLGTLVTVPLAILVAPGSAGRGEDPGADGTLPIVMGVALGVGCAHLVAGVVLIGVGATTPSRAAPERGASVDLERGAAGAPARAWLARSGARDARRPLDRRDVLTGKRASSRSIAERTIRADQMRYLVVVATVFVCTSLQ